MKLLKVVFYLFISLLASQLAHGQNSKKQTYLHGKQMYQSGNYEMAMEVLKPLTLPTNKSPFSPYAAYYYGLSAYEKGYSFLSGDMLEKLIAEFPDWDQIDLARFWLSKVYFREKEWKNGVNQIVLINNYALKENGNKLIGVAVNSIDSIEVIKKLYYSFPENESIGEVLADRIAQESLMDQDRELLMEIVNKFNLDREKYQIIDEVVSVKKDVYKIAVLLPFMKKDIIPNMVKRNNQFVLDVYEGILLAKNDLENKGIKLQLFAFDTEKSSQRTQEIVDSGELNGMDLIIGPLYPETVKIISDFALTHRINMFNPLSTNSDLIKFNPFSFLLKPTIESQALKTEEYLRDRIHNKNTLIFYENTVKDSIMAYTYKEALEKDSFNVIFVKKITRSDTFNIYKTLTKKIRFLDSFIGEEDSLRIMERYDLYDDFEKIYELEDYRDQVRKIQNLEILVIAPDSIGHIFVATDKELLGASIISGVETWGDSTVIIGDESWVDFNSLSLEQLEKLNVILISPGFISTDNPQLEDINQKIIYSLHCAPNKYHYTGYELMNFTGMMLYNHGIYFQTFMNKTKFIPGILYQGFDYSETNDNSVIPLVDLKNSEFRILNMY